MLLHRFYDFMNVAYAFIQMAYTICLMLQISLEDNVVRPDRLDDRIQVNSPVAHQVERVRQNLICLPGFHEFLFVFVASLEVKCSSEAG